MVLDVQEFVAAYPTCAHSKGSNRPDSGLLRLLPTPHRPQSHIFFGLHDRTATLRR